MNELALFAGAGGGILGGHLLGWNTVCAVEIEEYPRNILLQRQRDGILPPFPIWDDVCTFDGSPWRGLVDIISGGFPCQDISAAGKGAGITGSRSGLWKQMHRIICEVRPRFAFVENSPMLVRRGLGTVLADLAEAGYHAAWCVLGADDVGAPHVRKRIWILAEDGEAFDSNTYSVQCTQFRKQHEGFEELDGGRQIRMVAGREMADASCHRRNENEVLASLSGSEVCEASKREFERAGGLSTTFPDGCLPRSGWGEKSQRKAGGNSTERRERNAWWLAEPGLGRVADGVAHKMDRLRAIGNGQVPLVAATAFLNLNHILNQTLNIQN